MATQLKDFLTTVLTIRDATSDITGQLTRDSWSDLADPSKIDPLCIMSKDLLTTSYYEDILQAATNISSAYFLRALPFAFGKGEEIARVLKKLKPSRKIELFRDVERRTRKFAAEGLSTDYTYGLPVPSVNKRVVSMEQGFGRVPKNNIEDPVGMSVGKILEVDVPVGKNDITVPVTVTVTLNVMVVTPGIAAAIMSNETLDASFKERWFKYRAGRLGAWELLTGIGLVKKRQKLMLEDEHDILQTISSRRKAGLYNAAANEDDRSYGVSTNVMVITTTVAREVEKVHRGKISSNTTRKRIMNELSLMVLMVIDKEDETVDIYYRDTEQRTQLTIKSLNRVVKKDGPNIGEVMQAINNNRGSVF